MKRKKLRAEEPNNGSHLEIAVRKTERCLHRTPLSYTNYYCPKNVFSYKPSHSATWISLLHCCQKLRKNKENLLFYQAQATYNYIFLEIRHLLVKKFESPLYSVVFNRLPIETKVKLYNTSFFFPFKVIRKVFQQTWSICKKSKLKFQIVNLISFTRKVKKKVFFNDKTGIFPWFSNKATRRYIFYKSVKENPALYNPVPTNATCKY